MTGSAVRSKRLVNLEDEKSWKAKNLDVKLGQRRIFTLYFFSYLIFVPSSFTKLRAFFVCVYSKTELPKCETS